MMQIAQLHSDSPERTHELGVMLGSLLEPGHVIGLVGELGAGKTCLVAGAAEGLQVAPEIYVSSPTFTLINEYQGRILLVHIDFYRLNHPAELADLGIDDYYRSESACMVEWFDRFMDHAPREYLEVRLVVTGNESRDIELRAVGQRHTGLGRRWSGCWETPEFRGEQNEKG